MTYKILYLSFMALACIQASEPRAKKQKTITECPPPLAYESGFLAQVQGREVDFFKSSSLFRQLEGINKDIRRIIAPYLLAELLPFIKNHLVTPSLVIATSEFFPTSSVSFNPVGDRMVSSCMYSVRIWDVASGGCDAVLRGHENLVNEVSFNPAGDKVVSASKDGTVRIWDVASGKCDIVFRHEDVVNSVSFYPAGDNVVSASEDGTIRIWDIASGRCDAVLRGHENLVNSVSFNPAGDKVVSASEDGTIRIWDVASGGCDIVLRGHDNSVIMASFNPVGDKVVSVSDDRTVRIWDVASGGCDAMLRGHRGSIYIALFNPLGDKVVSASSDGMVRISDVGLLPKFVREVTYEQALVLKGIYEVAIARRLKETFSHERVARDNSIGVLEADQMFFDFALYGTALLETYKTLPQAIKDIFDPYVQNGEEQDLPEAEVDLVT